MAQQRADWVFAAEPRSIPQARRLIARRLIDLPRELVEVVLLLASELVTNAVRHGTGPVGVHLIWGAGDVRVDVADQAPDLPALRRLEPAARGGRGLLLVDALSDRWGVAAKATGKTVWFTVRA